MLLIPSVQHISTFKQLFAALTSLSLHLSFGICQGFSAVLIPQLQSPQSEFQITAENASWIASGCMISMPFGALFVGIFMEMCGRKHLIQFSFVPLIVGWTIIGAARSVFMLCIGRVITGFAIAMDPAVIIYIAETNTPKYRAVLLSLTGPTVLIGTLTSYLLGHYLHWRTAAFALSTLSALCFFMIFVIPESPVWLISRNNVKEATESLKWLRNETTVVKAELDELLQAKLSRSQDTCDDSFVQMIIASKAWKPFFILTVFFFLQQFCGVNIILYYAVNFYDAFGTPIDGFSSSLIYILLSLFFALVCTAIVKHVGRKTLTVVSATGVCVTCLLATVYEYVLENVPDKPVFWFPLVCMWLSVAFGMIGVNTLPWLMAGELFPARVRGVMTGILWVTVYVYMFISVKIYPFLVPFVKIYGILAIFSLSGFLTVLFGWLVLPETKGKSLIEIENSW